MGAWSEDLTLKARVYVTGKSAEEKRLSASSGKSYLPGGTAVVFPEVGPSFQITAKELEQLDGGKAAVRAAEKAEEKELKEEEKELKETKAVEAKNEAKNKKAGIKKAS
jgi:hypothetical protein